MGGGSSAHALSDPKKMQKQQAAQAYARVRKMPPEKTRPTRDRATLFAKERQEHHVVPPQDDIRVQKKKVKVADPRNSRPLLQMPGYVDSKVAAQRRLVEEEVKQNALAKEEAMQGRLISMGIGQEVIKHMDQEVNARRDPRKRRKDMYKVRIKKTPDEAVAMMTYSAWPVEQQSLMLDRLQYQRKWQVQKKLAEERAAHEERTYLYASASSEPAKAPALNLLVERNRSMLESMKTHAELMDRLSPRYLQNKADAEDAQGSDDGRVASNEKSLETAHEHHGPELPRWLNSLGIENEQTLAVARALSKTSWISNEMSRPTIPSLSKSASMPSPVSSPLGLSSPLSLSSPSSKRFSSKAESMASTAASLSDLRGTHEPARQDGPDGNTSFFLGNVS